jgi:DNA-binding CsgD family transcriptional regulator
VLYGRDPERAKVGELLEAARLSRSGALVIRGEPGIGKTALLEDTRDRAADMHVLSARGVQSESELPYAALHQLLRPAFDHIDRLSAPQAAALRGALGLGAGGGADRVLVFAACLSLLSELAERRPVLCLVDDAHWLDLESADALRFVARRLDAEGVAIVFCAREGDGSTFEGADLPSLTLAGLDHEAAATLLAHGAGVEAAPSVQTRLLEQTRGNALALLELPTVLTGAQLAGDAPLPEALPMTHQVEGVFLERVRRLPDDAQLLLLIAAADDSERLAIVTRAAELSGVSGDALVTVERAGLLSVSGTRLLFRHPLVRSAVYSAASSTERRGAHAALAEAMADDEDDADRRAWHLASSVVEPDDAVLLALEETAARAESRGAYTASVRALERAAELAPDGRSRGRALVGAARAASIAGAHDQARTLATQGLPLVDDPLLRAEVAQVLAVAEIQRGRSVDAASSLNDAARQVAAFDESKALELLLYSLNASSDGGDLEAQREASELAAAIAAGRNDEWSRFVVQIISGCTAMVEGDAARGLPLIEEGITWASETDDTRVAYWASACALWLGDDERTLALATRAVSLTRAGGEVGILAGALGVRASELFLSQRFAEAALAATEALQIARETGSENYALLGLNVLAAVAAIQGRDDEAREMAREVLERATARGLATRLAGARRALALVEMGRGRWAEALEHLDAAFEGPKGFNRPLVAVMNAPDRLEAAARIGRDDAASAALAEFEAWALSSGAPWAQPRLASCRALLVEGDEAETYFDEAVADIDRARPFDRARIQLLYGEHLRRKRRRLDARTLLRQALFGFEALGAEPWAERTRGELRATGETARKREPSTVDQLTPQELQIARYVAEGLSNREIAGRLFLSPRTIDSHLRNVFAKLSITSRMQLARIPLGDEGAADLDAEPSAV